MPRDDAVPITAKAPIPQKTINNILLFSTRRRIRYIFLATSGVLAPDVIAREGGKESVPYIFDATKNRIQTIPYPPFENGLKAASPILPVRVLCIEASISRKLLPGKLTR